MNDNPESPRQDTLRNAQKQITRSLFLALAALGVIVFACYAWFANNTSVTGQVGAVRLSGSRFELASVGSAGIQDKNLPQEYRVAGNAWEIDNKDGTITDSTNTILWRVSENSHLGNASGGSGIDPGSSGTLQFYVVPQGVDSLNLTFTLEIIPLKRQGDKQNFQLVQFTDPDPVAENFLKGHLLVRYQKDGEPNSTLVNPVSGSFELTVGADPVLVSLDWSWPYLLEDAIADKTVKSYVNSSPEYFLYDNKNPVQPVSFTLPEESNPEFRKYSNFYNNADQYIGTNVSAILFRLTAEE